MIKQRLTMLLFLFENIISVNKGEVLTISVIVTQIGHRQITITERVKIRIYHIN